MKRGLRLVASNPNPCVHRRFDGRTLHGIANLLTNRIRAGEEVSSSGAATEYRLSPFDIAIVAGWMARAGIDEQHILRAVVG